MPPKVFLRSAQTKGFPWRVLAIWAIGAIVLLALGMFLAPNAKVDAAAIQDGLVAGNCVSGPSLLAESEGLDPMPSRSSVVGNLTNVTFSDFAMSAVATWTRHYDFDGDGKTDAAIYRDAYWYIKTSSTGWSGLTTIWHGGVTGDKPLVGDFDGDGKADAVIYRDAYWYIKTSSTGWSGMITIWHGGVPGDEPLVGDFDGDGKADAVI